MATELEHLLNEQDINKQFLENRTIFLWGPVDEDSAQDVVKRLLYLDSQGNNDIRMLINSPGGSVTAGMAIYDAMQNVKSDVKTVCMGLAASMGAILLTAGTAGKRYVWPHSRVLIHQPMIGGQIVAPAIGIKIQADEMLRTKKVLNQLLANHTGQPLERIEKDTDRDYFMSAEEAKEYGMVDDITTQAI